MQITSTITATWTDLKNQVRSTNNPADNVLSDKEVASTELIVKAAVAKYASTPRNSEGVAFVELKGIEITSDGNGVRTPFYGRLDAFLQSRNRAYMLDKALAHHGFAGYLQSGFDGFGSRVVVALYKPADFKPQPKMNSGCGCGG